MSNILLSICIPTNNRVEILANTIQSILQNPREVLNKIELVISDNSKEFYSSAHLEKFNFAELGNFKIYHSSSEGYLNSIEALKLGGGQFLKLHNDYSLFGPGALDHLLMIIQKKIEKDAIISISNSNKKKFQTFISKKKFIDEISFYSSWSNLIIFPKSILSEIPTIDLNKMFPHTSILLFSHSNRKYFIIPGLELYNQELIKKGGYDLFQVFLGDFLGLYKLALEKNIINFRSYLKIKYDLYFNFILRWHSAIKSPDSNFTFEIKKADYLVKKEFGSILLVLMWTRTKLSIFYHSLIKS